MFLELSHLGVFEFPVHEFPKFCGLEIRTKFQALRVFDYIQLCELEFDCFQIFWTTTHNPQPTTHNPQPTTCCPTRPVVAAGIVDPAATLVVVMAVFKKLS